MLMRSPRGASEPLAGRESAQNLDAAISNVTTERHRAHRASTILDDDNIAVGGDGGARNAGDATDLAAQPNDNAAAGQQLTTAALDSKHDLARSTRGVDKGRGVNDSGRAAFSSGRADHCRFPDAQSSRS